MKNLQRWSLVAEIVGALAVVVSIVYLTIEVQRNTSAIQSQTSQGLLEMANETNQLLSLTPEMAELFMRAQTEYELLTPAEHLRWRRWVNSELNIWEHAFHSHAKGTLDDAMWVGYDVSYRAMFCSDSANRIWREIQTFYGADFREHVNGTTAEECEETSL